MTKLNEHQEYFLAEVAKVKLEFDAAQALLKADFDCEVEKLKEPIKAAVGHAVDHKVPARRLGDALNTSDHKTIKSYFPAHKGGPE